MKTQFEVWCNLDNEFCGSYDTFEEAKAVRLGVARFKGIFISDFTIINVVNE